VEGDGPEPGAPRFGLRGPDIQQQRVEEGLHELHALLYGLADEAAIGAARRAEGYAHVEADVPLVQAPRRLLRREGGVEAELCARAGDEVLPHEAALGRPG